MKFMNRVMMRILPVMIVFVVAALVMAGQGVDCSFARDGWNPDSWMRVKSPRWEHFGGWVQKDDCIENETPTGAKPKDLLSKLAGQIYSSMVLKEKFKGNVTVSVEMEFAGRMAPLIVIAPELGASAKGVPEYREHFEIVLFDKGVNVWHHFFKAGKPSWKKAAYSRFTLKPNTRYTLKVKLARTSRGKMMTVFVDGHEMGYMDESLPDEFYVGITGCEGVNRFYDFAVK